MTTTGIGRLVAGLGAAALVVGLTAACSGSPDDAAGASPQGGPPATSAGETSTSSTSSTSPGPSTTPPSSDGDESTATRPPGQPHTAPPSQPRGGGGNGRGGGSAGGDTDGSQQAVLSRLAGSSGGGCQTVGSRTDVRSGSLAAGNFAQARTSFADGDSGGKPASLFLYVIPEHSGAMPGVTITVDPLSTGAAKTQTFKAVETAEQWQYYPSSCRSPPPAPIGSP